MRREVGKSYAAVDQGLGESARVTTEEWAKTPLRQGPLPFHANTNAVT